MRALPSVSVCIPVYRGEQFLAETIRSVLDQTYRDFELVILDNASPDDSGRIARSFGDRRIRVETNATTLPQPENWCEAVRRAGGLAIKLGRASMICGTWCCLEYEVGWMEVDSVLAVVAFRAAHDIDERSPRARPPPRAVLADGARGPASRLPCTSCAMVRTRSACSAGRSSAAEHVARCCGMVN